MTTLMKGGGTMSIKTALGAFGVSMLAASAAMAGGLGNSDNALNDYVTNIQGADQMSAKQMEETKGKIADGIGGYSLGYQPVRFPDPFQPPTILEQRLDPFSPDPSYYRKVGY
jgi:hypothetical protein